MRWEGLLEMELELGSISRMGHTPSMSGWDDAVGDTYETEKKVCSLHRTQNDDTCHKIFWGVVGVWGLCGVGGVVLALGAWRKIEKARRLPEEMVRGRMNFRGGGGGKWRGG